jgi:hypothetical protein
MPVGLTRIGAIVIPIVLRDRRSDMEIRDYKGFDLHGRATALLSGIYVASVTLSRRGPHARVRTFDVPLADELLTEQEAVGNAIQHGLDLVDGLLPCFDPETF